MDLFPPLKQLGNSGPRVFAFDIETDTFGDPYVYENGTPSNHPAGLDPRVSRITTLTAVGSDGTIRIFDGGSEWEIIRHARELIDESVTVGWNSLFFDIPFIIARASILKCEAPRVVKSSDSSKYPKYGYPEWWKLVSHNHWNEVFARHRDLCFDFKQFAEDKGIKWSLKPVCAALGIDMIEEDASNMHELSAEQRIAYNLSDARGTLKLLDFIDD